MHAMQIGSMETISATTPLKVSGSTPSSTLPEAFGPKLQRDMLAADADVAGSPPLAAMVSFATNAPIVKVTSPPTDGSPGKNAFRPQPSQGRQPTLTYGVQSAATPMIAAGLGGSATARPIIEGPADATTLPAVKIGMQAASPTQMATVSRPPTEANLLPATQANGVPVLPTKLATVPTPPTEKNTLLATQANGVPAPPTKAEAVSSVPATEVIIAPVPVPVTQAQAVSTMLATQVGAVPVLSTKVNAVPVPPSKANAMPSQAAKAGSAGIKHAAKASGPANSSEIIYAQGLPSDGSLVVLSTAVQIDIPAEALQGQAQPTPAAENLSPIPSLSPLPKPVPPTAVVASDDPALAQGILAGPVSVQSGSLRQASLTVAVQSKTQLRTTSVSAAFDTGNPAIPANTAVPFSIAGSPHSNQVAALHAVAQTPTPIVPAPPSVRADLQSPVTTSLNSAGTGEVHMFPSVPTQLDVGVLDGTHGWLRIRAELGAGGGVSASLTASPLAHESLNAALPEMAKYLGSEGVSVSNLAVHRYAEDANPVLSSTPEGQLNADTQGHRSGGSEQKNGSGTQENQPERAEMPSTPVVSAPTVSLAGPDVDDNEALSGSTQGFSHSAPEFFSPLGFAGGSSGNWVNVSA